MGLRHANKTCVDYVAVKTRKCFCWGGKSLNPQGMEFLQERSLPVAPAVHSACELLGMDPIYVANEGKVVVVVPAEQADEMMLMGMRQAIKCSRWSPKH